MPGSCAQGIESPAGSYFVSTYPPFSCWTEAQLPEFQRTLGQPASSAPEVPLGLYVHIPFCVKRCPYCYYLSYDDRPDEADRYLDGLVRELRRYADTPALSGRKPTFVYFGGGTPSLFSSARILRLMDGLQAALPWTDVREVTFECAPKSVTVAKLRILRESGVTRVSLGVQQLDDEVLRASGRVHLTLDVERAYEAIREVEFDLVNVDLMVGLPGESTESFRSSLERIIELAPESVTIYQLEVPLNTPLYRALRDGEVASPPASWKAKRARLRDGFDRLEAAGYTVSSAYAAVLDPVMHRFLYQQDQYRGADLLGIGASSFTYLSGIHQQNVASMDTYMERISRDSLPLGRAYALSDEERLIREFVLQLKLGGVDAEYFRGKFGVEPAERFGQPLRRMADRGWLSTDDRGVRLTRDGLLRVDRLIPEFYLPAHQGIRYS